MIIFASSAKQTLRNRLRISQEVRLSFAPGVVSDSVAQRPVRIQQMKTLRASFKGTAEPKQQVVVLVLESLGKWLGRKTPD